MVQDYRLDASQQLRELTEQNVAQARAAFGQFMDAMAQATNMWLGSIPSNGTTSGLKVMHERAVRFTR